MRGRRCGAARSSEIRMRFHLIRREATSSVSAGAEPPVSPAGSVGAFELALKGLRRRPAPLRGEGMGGACLQGEGIGERALDIAQSLDMIIPSVYGTFDPVKLYDRSYCGTSQKPGREALPYEAPPSPAFLYSSPGSSFCFFTVSYSRPERK